MGTKTIGLREDVYERLRAKKREGESFTELVDRLLDETDADWQEGFGTLDADEAAELEQVADRSRTGTGVRLGERQRDAIEGLAEEQRDEE